MTLFDETSSFFDSTSAVFWFFIKLPFYLIGVVLVTLTALPVNLTILAAFSTIVPLVVHLAYVAFFPLMILNAIFGGQAVYDGYTRSWGDAGSFMEDVRDGRAGALSTPYRWLTDWLFGNG